MPIENQRRGSTATYVVAIIVVVAVIVVTAASLWQPDNSATNVLSGDPNSTSPPSPQGAP
jgi:hypothetical protein